jgi:hypothetical protein
MRFLRIGASLATLAVLAGCGSHRSPQLSNYHEAQQYAARAKQNYTAPGPAGDPWGPYIVEAAAKYDVPEQWIRAVMHQESGGRLYENGEPITSDAGAMGLMQVMPQTYDELRQRYALGDDPFDPHDNIMAGTAYIREMYDVYGAPGFLAAYNAGPGRLDDYLTHNKPLPDETRHYVASIGPNIAGVYPQHPSESQQYAMNQLPINIPAGPRYPRNNRGGAPVALANAGPSRNGWQRGDVQTASLPEPPPQAPPPPPIQMASANVAARTGQGFHLVSRAVADTIPVRIGGPTTGNWAIQVGAFGNQNQARAATEAARGQARVMLASAHEVIGTVRQAKATLYRARLTGLSRDAAIQACEKLSKKNCIVVSPDAQS